MKATACSYVYWPGMDEDVMDMVHNCSKYQEAAKMLPKQPTAHVAGP